MPTYERFCHIFCEKIDDYIEICDHVFIVSGLRIMDGRSASIFKEKEWVKVWESHKRRQYCEICEKNFGAITATFKTPKETYVGQHLAESCIICPDCHSKYCEEEPLNQNLFRYNYHASGRTYGKNSYKSIYQRLW